MQHQFTYWGKVRGQGRPRVTYQKRGTYKAKADKDYERGIRDAYINSNGPWFGKKPLELIVVVHRKLPDSFPKRITFESDTHKPDASNILKSIEDALNKIAYYDDAQIVHADVVKVNRMRDVEEHIDVTIREVVA